MEIEKMEFDTGECLAKEITIKFALRVTEKLVGMGILKPDFKKIKEITVEKERVFERRMWYEDMPLIAMSVEYNPERIPPFIIVITDF